MDRSKFDGWVQDAGLDSKVSAAFYTSMGDYANADKVLTMATKRGWSAKQMLSLLKNQGVFTAGIEAVMDQSSTPELTPLPARRIVRPVSPVFDPPSREASADEPAQKPSILQKLGLMKPSSDDHGTPKKGLSRTWGIVVIVVVAFVLMAVGYFMFAGNSGSGSYDFSAQPSFAEPAPTYEPALEFAPQTPEESLTRQPEEVDRWQQFVDLNRISSEASGPFLDKPSDWKDIFNKFPTRWFLWIAFLYPIWTLLKQDRLASEELTDVKAAKRGLLALIVGVLLAGLLSTAATYLAINIIGVSIEIPRYLFISMGIVVNLFVQWTAAMNGRKDYSTFSIGGLFFTGVLLIWWFTPNLPMIVLGSLFMAGGILLQNVEMRRTHQGWQAHLTALVMLLMFAGIMGIVYFALGFIPPITVAMPWIQQFLFAILYSGRLFIGASIGLMAAFAGGDYVSTSIMPPSMAGEVSLAGNRLDDDMSHKYDVNSRYDAMAYAIMILYPITTAIWQIALYF